MKSKSPKSQKELEKEYFEMMKGFQKRNTFFFQTQEGKSPNDLIEKFSLYEEAPLSITSTDTLLTLENNSHAKLEGSSGGNSN